MPRRIVSNSFVSGEISPELYGRHDLKVYFNGAARLENFIVRRTGGIRKRPGTETIAFLDPNASNEKILKTRFRVFPYFFDSAVFGLVVFTIVTRAGNLKAKLILFDDTTTTPVTVDKYSDGWVTVGVKHDIYNGDDLDQLSAKQVGDTLFFTRPDATAFKCAVTRSTLSLDFSPIYNATTVPPPAAITATATGFKETTGHKFITKQYALFGVKDGILSKPKTASATATTPWYAGATVTVAGTLDFAKHDYYILAKKTGMNWGKISEIYPIEQIDPVTTTITDEDFAEGDADSAFHLISEKAMNPSPYDEATGLASISLTPNSMLIKATTYDDSGNTKYRVATPHFAIPLEGATTSQIKLTLRPDLVRNDTYASIASAFASKTITVTPFYYSRSKSLVPGANAIHLMDSQSKTTSSDSELVVDVGDIRASYFGLILETDNAALSTHLAVGGVTILQGGQPIACTSALTEYPEDYGEDENAERVACHTACYVRPSDTTYWLTNAWNSPATTLSIFAQTAADYTNMKNRVRVQTKCPDAKDHHLYAFSVSDITFTVPEANKTLSTLTLYHGANLLNIDTGEAFASTPGTFISGRLYVVNGSEETEIASVLIDGSVGEVKASVQYGGETPTTTYRLLFDSPVIIRGVQFYSTNNALQFVDDNIIPGDITGQQDMIVVGDTGMDCSEFDIFQQRTVFASSAELPFTLWFSATGDIYNFYADRPQADNNAFSVTIPAKRASKIHHILAAKELMLFTEDGVYTVDADGGNGFSYRTVRLKRICDAACDATVSPIAVDSKVLFVGEDGRTMYELAYNLMEDSITPTDRTVHAYHLTEQARIVKIVHQRFPDGIVWCLLDDGNLIGMTYLPEHEVWAWHQHSFGTTTLPRKIIDILSTGCVLSEDGLDTTSQILLVVEGTDPDYPLWKFISVETMRPTLCSDQYTDEDSVLCIDHKGDDGNESPVAAKLITLRPESQEVSTQGVPKRIIDVCLRLRRSGKVSVKPFETGIAAVESGGTTTSGTTTTLFSGDLKIMPRGFINGDGQMEIASTDSLPCEILSAVYTLDIPT